MISDLNRCANFHARPPESALLLLIVDDDPLISDTLEFHDEHGLRVITSHSRPHCMQLLATPPGCRNWR
jgi:hypothetical protein